MDRYASDNGGQQATEAAHDRLVQQSSTRGRPQQTIRNCLVRAIQCILRSVTESALTSEWLHLAEDPNQWNQLMADAGLRQTCVSR